MGSRTFCSSGCFTVPAGVTSLCVQVWGAGGHGGEGCRYFCGCCTRYICTYGGGGGGGGYAKGKVPVTAGNTYAVHVGVNPGCGASTFTGNCSKMVGGHVGACGAHGYCGGTGDGGAGGTGYGTASCLSTATGHPGFESTGGKGACPCGGAGGSGGGNPGTPPGGGGGGGYSSGGQGGAGGHGRVKISWTCPMLEATASATPTSGKRPLCVAFSACPTGGTPPYSYSWHFGSCGGTSTAKAPTHRYITVGTFCPTVEVSDSVPNHVCPSVPQIHVAHCGGQSRRVFCSSGCWTVPCGVTQVCVQAWGGGGAGACWTSCPCDVEVTQGGGGGGGGYGKGKVPVTAGSKYAVTVGGAGADSHFTGNCCEEVGGHHGSCGSPGAGGAGGNGFGSGASTTNRGACGSVEGGGYGANPCGGAGGVAGYHCGCTLVESTPGSRPGGGGAGGRFQKVGYEFGATVGGPGRVTLTYCCPSAPCPPLTATASAKPTKGKKGVKVQFKVCPSGGATPYAYLWCFGCACHVTSTCRNPLHTYPSDGTFSPKVNVTCPFYLTACPAVPQITVSCSSSCCCNPSTQGTLGNFHIGRDPIPRLSNPRRIVRCCSIGGT